MAFWGVEVKPGKPYTHVLDGARSRLRISQATLGSGKSDNKCTIQCNVGDKSPVLLCSLIPDKLESCHLELEFEEAEEVVFSVLGQRSVHLAGYFIGSSVRKLDGDDDTDSYGEDIAESDASESYSDDEDEYESDFIDDDGFEMFPPSGQRNSGVVIEEIIDDDKPSSGNANRRRLKKKHQLSDSEDGGDGSEQQVVVKGSSPIILESEDEDGFPICFISRKKKVVKDSEGNSILKSDRTLDEDGKKKTSAHSQDEKSTRDTTQAQHSDTLGPSETDQENNRKSKKKKKAKDEKPVSSEVKVPAEEGVSIEPGQDNTDKVVATQKDGGQSGEANTECLKIEAHGVDSSSGKEKKKKKKTKKGKITGENAEVPVERIDDKNEEHANGAADDDKMDQDHLVNGEVEKLPNRSEVVDPLVPSTTSHDPSEKSTKRNKKKRTKEERGSDADGGAITDVNNSVAKKKKKENKQEPQEEGKSEVTKSVRKARTYSNGLVVEELAMGKPDGERATQGEKVFVNYIGKLKDGKIFDSTVGKRPFGFRLGIGEVIKGWDVGVNGMRVGDKRRLTVPPSYGYGPKQTGPIPPNSWLIFDVELVSVK